MIQVSFFAVVTLVANKNNNMFYLIYLSTETQKTFSVWAKLNERSWNELFAKISAVLLAV